MGALTSEAIVQIADLQQITPGDLNAGERLARGSLDNVVGAFLATSLVYSGLAVALDPNGNGTRAIVGTGLLYDGASNGAGYALRDPFTVDLGQAIAAVPADKTALVAVLAQGFQGEDGTETRTVLDASKEPTNPEDFWPTTTLPVKTRVVRSAIISRAVGTADVQPQMPAYGGSLCLVATIRINNLGIVSITQNEAARIERLADVAQDTAGAVADLARISPLLASLLSTTSALALQLAAQKAAYDAALAELQNQLNQLKTQTNNQGSQQQTGSAPILSGFDVFVDASQTDVNAAGYSALISDGLRFPVAASDNQAITVTNPFAGSVKVLGSRYLLPAYTEVVSTKHLANSGNVQRSTSLGIITGSASVRGLGVSRTRWDRSLTETSVAQLIASGDPTRLFATRPEDLAYDPAWGDWRVSGPELIRKNGYAKDLTGRGPWSRIDATVPFANKLVLDQPYQSASAEMITAIDVRFAGSANGEPVQVLVTADLNGNPDLSRTYASVSIDPANAPDKITFPYPILRKAGEKVHFVHLFPGGGAGFFLYFADVSAQFGILKAAPLTYTGGQWTPFGSGLELNFSVYRASFSGAGPLRVPLSPVILAGGIDGVDLVTPAIVPEGASIDYETQIAGAPVALAPVTGIHPLNGGVQSLPLTALLSYTEAVAPIFDFQASKSRVVRSGTALRHVSAARIPTTGVTKIQESVTLYGFDSAAHTVTARLLTGAGYATETAPTTVVDLVQADGSLKRTFTWSLGSTVTAHEVALIGTRSDLTKQLVGRRADWTAAP